MAPWVTGGLGLLKAGTDGSQGEETPAYHHPRQHLPPTVLVTETASFHPFAPRGPPHANTTSALTGLPMPAQLLGAEAQPAPSFLSLLPHRAPCPAGRDPPAALGGEPSTEPHPLCLDTHLAAPPVPFSAPVLPKPGLCSRAALSSDSAGGRHLISECACFVLCLTEFCPRHGTGRSVFPGRGTSRAAY